MLRRVRIHFSQYTSESHDLFTFISVIFTFRPLSTHLLLRLYVQIIYISIFRSVRKIVKSDFSLRHDCPYVRMEQFGSLWTDFFNEIWYAIIFRKSVEKITVWLKSDKNNRYFTWKSMYITNASHWILFKMRNLSKLYRESEHTFYGQWFFPPKIVPFMRSSGKIWYDHSCHDGNKIRHVRFACWITKATNTRS
jgi:hypothetical protein